MRGGAAGNGTDKLGAIMETTIPGAVKGNLGAEAVLRVTRCNF